MEDLNEVETTRGFSELKGPFIPISVDGDLLIHFIIRLS